MAHNIHFWDSLITRVFLAAPLRRQVIVKEKLVFPSGSRFMKYASKLTVQLPPPNLSLSYIRSHLLIRMPHRHAQAELISVYIGHLGRYLHLGLPKTAITRLKVQSALTRAKPWEGRLGGL